jgi:hypothetical protein
MKLSAVTGTMFFGSLETSGGVFLSLVGGFGAVAMMKLVSQRRVAKYSFAATVRNDRG